MLVLSREEEKEKLEHSRHPKWRMTSSPSFELASALAGAPAAVLETAMSLLDASAPLMDGAAAAGTSAEDRKVWLAAVARLAIRVVAVLEGADDDDDKGEEQGEEEEHTFDAGKSAPAQQPPPTLSALLAALDVRCVVLGRNRRASRRHLAELELARGRRGGGREGEADLKKKKKSHPPS